MKKTGVFSGSFNPVHIGHLALANWLCEYESLDEVWFLVTPQNPLKKDLALLDDGTRYRMVEKAIDGYPKFKVSDLEFSLPKPSYTIDTLTELQKRYPERLFHFIMGADNWLHIEQWKDYGAILRNFPVIIYPRLGYEAIIPDNYPSVRLVKAPVIEISSSFIRQACREGKNVRFFLPESVRDQFCDRV